MAVPTFYTPKYLKAHELCDREFYNAAKKVNEIYVFWQFNPLVLMTADLLRERYGSITVNNWFTGGSLSQRGLRSNDSTGAFFGPHKRGAALDCNFKNATPEEIRKDMERLGCYKPGFKSNFTDVSACFQHIGRVENTEKGKQITWFHFDIWNSQATDGSIIKLDI